MTMSVVDGDMRRDYTYTATQTNSEAQIRPHCDA